MGHFVRILCKSLPRRVRVVDMESTDPGTKHFRGILNIYVTIDSGGGYKRREENILVDMHVREGMLNSDYPFVHIVTLVKGTPETSETQPPTE